MSHAQALMEKVHALGDRLGTRLRHVPRWVYIVVVLAGLVWALDAGYQYNQYVIDSQAAADNVRIKDTLFRSALIAGVYFQLHVNQSQPLQPTRYRVQPADTWASIAAVYGTDAATIAALNPQDARTGPVPGKDVTVSGLVPLPFDRPFTTQDSYTFELDPALGADCPPSTPVQQFRIELLSPAFTIDPSDRETTPVQLLQAPLCTVASTAAVPTYRWGALAKQDGHHVLSVRVVGLDAHGNQVSEQTIRLPVIVSDNPITWQAVLEALTALGVLFGILTGIADLVRHSRASPP